MSFSECAKCETSMFNIQWIQNDPVEIYLIWDSLSKYFCKPEENIWENELALC